MLISTKSIINRFCSFVFITVFMAIFIYNGTGWYTVNFERLKTAITEQFAQFPGWQIEKGFKSVFGVYLKLTNRSAGNGVIVLNDGRLIFETESNPPLLPDKADEIIRLNDYLSYKDTPFLFIRASDGMHDNSQLPYGLQDSITTVSDTSSFISHLHNNGVNILDLREEMKIDNIDYPTSYYRGDHHWNVFGALYGYRKIGEIMNNEYNFNLDSSTWDISEYDSVTYQKSFIGKLSYRLGNTAEDVTALLPKWQTEIEIRNLDPLNSAEHLELLKIGSFVDVFIPEINNPHNSVFEYKDLNAFRNGFYRYTNTDVQGNEKILFIADSFGTVPATYLSTAVKHVDFLYLSDINNPRLYPLLAQENYNLVLFLLYDGTILSGGDDMDGNRLNLGNPVDITS